MDDQSIVGKKIVEAARLAEQAVELGKDDFVALSNAGICASASSATSMRPPLSLIRVF